MKQCAPKELVEDWIINSWLPPFSAKAKNARLRIKDKVYTGADFTVFYEIDDTNRVLHVSVYCPGFADIADEERKRDMSAYMLELFLGELELEARIASVTAVDKPLSDSENFCLLPNFYEDVCDIVIDREWLEYREPTNIYMAYKINEEGSDDRLRKDMKLIVTTNSLLQEELLQKNYDSCLDFRDKGGEYGYLYYENPYEDEKSALIRQTMGCCSRWPSPVRSAVRSAPATLTSMWLSSTKMPLPSCWRIFVPRSALICAISHIWKNDTWRAGRCAECVSAESCGSLFLCVFIGDTTLHIQAVPGAFGLPSDRIQPLSKTMTKVAVQKR